jgi:hypothetical protein
LAALALAADKASWRKPPAPIEGGIHFGPSRAYAAAEPRLTTRLLPAEARCVILTE